MVSLVIFVDDNWSNDDDVVVQKTGEKLVWIEDEHIKKALEVVRKLGTLQ